MKYYIKKLLLISVYLVSSGLLASSVLVIEGMAWLRLVLLILNLALFMFIYCAIAFKDGEKALRVRISNDKLRELIVQTGDDYKLNLEGEFTVKKGFITGLFACLPLIFLLLINILFYGPTARGSLSVQVAEFIYMAFFAFFNLDFFSAHNIVLYASPYWMLISIPILIVLEGVFFYLGAKNLEKQQEKIKSTHRMLHGE